MWARVVTASRTTVVPWADSPASRMADFTWALATLAVQSIPCSAPPRTRSGGRQRSPRPVTVAPMSPRGSATRSMGRLDSDASPVSSVSQSNPATRPASRRMEVPEFPQSSGAPGPVQAAPAAVDHDGPVVVALHAGPHGLHRGQRGGHVGPVGQPVDDRGALGQRAEQHGPVRDRLLARRAHGAPAR